MNEEDEGRLASALVPDLISSEESGEEEVDTLCTLCLGGRER